jgi:hypothetical protein
MFMMCFLYLIFNLYLPATVSGRAYQHGTQVLWWSCPAKAGNITFFNGLYISLCNNLKVVSVNLELSVLLFLGYGFWNTWTFSCGWSYPDWFHAFKRTKDGIFGWSGEKPFSFTLIPLETCSQNEDDPFMSLGPVCIKKLN